MFVDPSTKHMVEAPLHARTSHPRPHQHADSCIRSAFAYICLHVFDVARKSGAGNAESRNTIRAANITAVNLEGFHARVSEDERGVGSDTPELLHESPGTLSTIGGPVFTAAAWPFSTQFFFGAYICFAQQQC